MFMLMFISVMWHHFGQIISIHHFSNKESF